MLAYLIPQEHVRALATERLGESPSRRDLVFASVYLSYMLNGLVVYISHGR